MAELEDDYGEVFLPAWKQKMMSLNQEKSLKDIADDDSKDYLIKENEIALKHPVLDSIIKLTDDGFIDIFPSPSLGIRLDPQTNSINFIGDTVNFITKNTNVLTEPKGFSWNKYAFNPELYMENSTEKEQHITGTKNYWVYSKELGWHWERRDWSIPPMLKMAGKPRYSEGLLQIMKTLNLPID